MLFLILEFPGEIMILLNLDPSPTTYASWSEITSQYGMMVHVFCTVL